MEFMKEVSRGNPFMGALFGFPSGAVQQPTRKTTTKTVIGEAKPTKPATTAKKPKPRPKAPSVAARKPQQQQTMAPASSDGKKKDEEKPTTEKKNAESTRKVAPVLSSARGWRTVRVFVSSTFSDMFGEREALVKRVFPALSDWCKGRRLWARWCDLRWGVPKDSATSDALRTCLGEIDRCERDDVGLPFFVCLLGERYGWVPTDVPVDIATKYSWVNGRSVTEMEIRHGALRFGSNPNAAFFIRNAESLDAVPTAVKSDVFVEGDTDGRRKLADLKDEIRQTHPEATFGYAAAFGGATNGVPAMTGLEKFADSVLEFLKGAIVRQYPEDPRGSAATEWRALDDLHDGVLQTALRGCGNDVAAVDTGEDYRRVTVQGAGSSTALCALFAKLKADRGNRVFYHAVDASSDSSKIMTVIRRIVNEFGSATLAETRSVDEIHDNLLKVLFRVSTVPRKHYILIDHIDHIEVEHNAKPDWWVPQELPKNVQFVVTTTDPLKCRGWHVVSLPQMNDTDAAAYVERSLAAYGKTLEELHMNSLNSKKSSKNPIWLSLAIEELLVFGVFEQLGRKVGSLPNGVEELVGHVADRIASEQPLATRFLSFIAVSHAGIEEDEMAVLLQQSPKEGPLPVATLALVRQSCKSLLRDGSGRLQFSHESFRKAIIDRTDASVRSELAAFFESCCLSAERIAEELPWLVQALGDRARLATCLSRWEVLERWYTEESKYQLIEWWTNSGQQQEMVKLYGAMLARCSRTITDKEELGRRYFMVAELLFHMALWQPCFDLCTEADAMTNAIHFGCSEVRGLVVNLLGRVLEKLGKEEQSLRAFEEVVRIRTKVFGSNSLTVAHSLNNLAVFHIRHGKKYWLALPIYEKALTIVNACHTNREAETADLLMNIGQCKYEEGKREEAMGCLNKSLEMRTAIQGENHPKVGMTHANIGNILKARGEYDEAWQHYRTALDCTTAVYGYSHPLAANDMVNLGSILVCLKNESDAFEMYRDAHAIREEYFGPEHPLTKEVESLMSNYEQAYYDAMESGPAIVHRKCF